MKTYIFILASDYREVITQNNAVLATRVLRDRIGSVGISKVIAAETGEYLGYCKSLDWVVEDGNIFYCLQAINPEEDWATATATDLEVAERIFESGKTDLNLFSKGNCFLTTEEAINYLFKVLEG